MNKQEAIEKINEEWFNGYTVEKEKLYTVEIPNPKSKRTLNGRSNLPSH